MLSYPVIQVLAYPLQRIRQQPHTDASIQTPAAFPTGATFLTGSGGGKDAPGGYRHICAVPLSVSSLQYQTAKFELLRIFENNTLLIKRTGPL